MKNRTRTIGLAAGLAAAALVLAGCSQADVASRNLSHDADSFKIERRIVFYNGITDKYILEVEGRCALGNEDDSGQLTVTCKTGEDSYKKHFLGLSDNVTYFAEQLKSKKESGYHYKVLFKPETLVPSFDGQTSK
jgi:hypothetical protein